MALMEGGPQCSMCLVSTLNLVYSANICKYVCLLSGGTYYSTGSLGIAWFILWALFVHSSPAEHPRISTAEKLYIESSLAAENRRPVVSIYIHLLICSCVKRLCSCM